MTSIKDNIIWYNKDGRFYDCGFCSMPNCSSRNTTSKINCLLDQHEVTVREIDNKVMKAKESPETYPVQFKDKIDEYLWKEHHILGGCCSSIEEMKYSVAREVAEKLTDAFIEKAVAFLKERIILEDNSWYIEGQVTLKDKMIEDFVKYMKGE